VSAGAEIVAMLAMLFIGGCAVGVVLAIAWIAEQELDAFERFARAVERGELE
jgi:hypothetical protein